MRILLVSTYELGHQPLHVASPAGALRAAGHEVRCLDLAVDPWRPELVDWAGAIALSVPMHTAMRLAMRVARAVRRQRPSLPVCFYGLYAPVSRDLTLAGLADRLIAGEYEPGLLAWARALDSGAAPSGAGGEALVQLGRGTFTVPARDLLPPLEAYAHLSAGGDERLVGYVEASHGCVHRCRHCPVPAVYDGRIRIVGADVVVADVVALHSMGARHITFGDPDFLNGRRHSLEVVRAVHERLPELTFDVTTKVEHVLEHADVWPALADAGCLFVVCALETVDDDVLRTLDKGHTTAEAARAVALLREHGIEPRPSFLPFTPWTRPADVLDLLAWVAEHDLIPNVDPVQYGIRLLLPEGSLLLDHPELRPHLGPYDAEALTYTWTAADPEADALQVRIAARVEEAAAAGEPVRETFDAVWALARDAAGRGEEAPLIAAGSVEGRPRLTEPWFC